jgi:hypothetical protein
MDNINQPLNPLVGMELSSIEFVRDYIQFRFDGPCLTAVTDPYLLVENRRYNRSDASFCNILLSFIGSKVEETMVKEHELIRIKFSAGRSINISLKSVDYITVEAARFDDGSGKWWVL